MDKYEKRRLKLIDLINNECGEVNAELARRIGRDPSYVNRMLYPEGKKGKKRIADDMIEVIEKAFNLPRGWLDGIENDAVNIEPAAGLRGRVPLISWVQAGDFNHANDQFPPGYADEFVETTVNVGRHTFALRVKGDSMEPNFPEGAILIIEPDMDFQPGDFVIAKNGDNEATFKQLVKDGADWYLKPLNPRYPIKPLGASAIIGVVREAIQKLR